MCQALRELMKDEIQEEIQAERKDVAQKAAQEAAQKATDSTTIANIKNLMQTLSMDAKAAMEALKISATDQLRYIAML